MSRYSLLLIMLHVLFGLSAQTDVKALRAKVKDASTYLDSVKALNHLSEYYRVVSPDSAMVVSVLAYNISLREQDTICIIQSGNQLSMVYKEVGKTKLALSTILKSSTHHVGSFVDTLAGSTSLIKGHIYSELNDLPSAIKYYNEAIENFLLSQDSIGLSYAYSGLGIVYYDQGDLEKALNSYKKSEVFWKDSTGLIADLWNNLGAVYVEFEEWENAEKYYMKSLDLYEQKDWKTDISMVYYNLGELYMLATDYPKSATFYFQSLETAKDINSGVDIQWALFGLYEVFKTSGDVNEALVYHEKYADYKDSLQELYQEKEVAQLEHYYFEQQKLKTTEAENKLYQSKAEKSDLETRYYKRFIYVILAGIIFIALFGLFMYRRQKSINQMLSEKNDAIEVKNHVIDTALKEKENLLKEIHHRVKNNLQIISSLLNLQSHQLDDETAIKALSESKNKIQAIALVHEKLYKSSNYTSVELVSYLQELSDHQQNMYANNLHPIKISVDGASVNVSTDVAVPLGLIFAELITNSFKHAFSNTENPAISISLSQKDNSLYQLDFQDNGKGLPTEFSFDNSESLGMEIIKALSEQIAGYVEFKNSKGANFKIFFKPNLS